MRKIVLTFLVLSTFFSYLLADQKLDQIQQAIASQNAAWQAGENWVSRLAPEEKLQLLGASLQPVADAAEKYIELEPAALPASLDWRENGGDWVTPVKNQANCGSCWDFSAVAQVESWWKITRANPDTNLDLSEQYILSCGDVGSCSGGSTEGALTFFSQTGVPLEQCLPYQANDSVPCENACEDWHDHAVTIPGWGYVTLEEADVENIKQAVYRHPVSASYTVYEDFYSYIGGVYEHVWGEAQGGHAILIVGWNNAEQSWICKNSWGPVWGENGYFRIKWGDSGIGEYLPFVYSGLSGPALQISHDQLQFDILAGDSARQILTLTNTGTDILEVACIDEEVPLAWHVSEFNAYDDSSWWCGYEDLGGYNDHWLQYLDTPQINLTQTQSPELVFDTFWAVEHPGGAESPWDGWDGCNVWVSTDAGQSFDVALPTVPVYTNSSLWSFGNDEQGWSMGTGIPGWTGKSGGWIPALFDLSSYKSKDTIIRFAFASDMGFCTTEDPQLFGFFIDNIKVKDDENVIFENNGSTQPAMYQYGFGSRVAEWLSMSNNVRAIAPGQQLDVPVSVTTKNLATGSYSGRLVIQSNDSTTAEIKIPIQLNVLARQHDAAVQKATASEDTVLILSDLQVSAIIKNAGEKDMSSFETRCELFQNERKLASRKVAIPSLAADESKDVNFTLPVPADTGYAVVRISLMNASQDQNTYNNQQELYIYVSNLIDHFEASDKKWEMSGGWGLTDQYQGHESSTAAHVNNGVLPYKPNMDAVMRLVQPMRVAGLDSMWLTYWTYSYTEEFKDVCYVEISRDKQHWTKVDSVSGAQPSFVQRHVPLEPFTSPEDSLLWLQYHFFSDSENELVGVFIDDVSFFAVPVSPSDTTIAQVQNHSPVRKTWKLLQNYPNPFNPVTMIGYELLRPGRVQISVFNINGQIVETLVDADQSEGIHQVSWHAGNAPSGVYFYRLLVRTRNGIEVNEVKKMVLVR